MENSERLHKKCIKVIAKICEWFVKTQGWFFVGKLNFIYQAFAQLFEILILFVTFNWLVLHIFDLKLDSFIIREAVCMQTHAK